MASLSPGFYSSCGLIESARLFIGAFLPHVKHKGGDFVKLEGGGGGLAFLVHSRYTIPSCSTWSDSPT